MSIRNLDKTEFIAALRESGREELADLYETKPWASYLLGVVEQLKNAERNLSPADLAAFRKEVRDYFMWGV